MANTKEAVELQGQTWEDVTVLTGIPTGTAITIQNLSPSRILVAISPARPEDNFKGSVLMEDAKFLGYVTAGEDKVWLKGRGFVSIQEG